MAQEYGGIETVAGATGTTDNIVGSIGTTFVRVTGFDELAPSNGVAANDGVDQLEISGEGVYFAFFQATFWASTQATPFEFGVIKGTATVMDIRAETLAVTGTVNQLSMGGMIEVDAGDVYHVGVRVGAGSGEEITLKNASFNMFRLS